MKKHLGFTMLTIAALSLHGKAGDTTRVRTHDKVLIQTDPSKGHTEYSAWGKFPSPGKTYNKMYAELTFQCPKGLMCGEWDYLNYIFLGQRKGANNDTLNWEIARFITPYGKQFNQQWKHTWKFDITDFASLFNDSIEIWYQHTGYEAKNDRGWLVTLDFVMIEGPEIRPVKSVKQLWRKSVPYGNDSLFEARAPETRFQVGNETRELRYKILQTGHGADKPENCGEFCAKYRFMRHNNETDTSVVWRFTCGENPVFPQAGTWIYDRAGWCPGAEVLEYNLDKPTNPLDSHVMDLDMESYTKASGNGNYMITAWLVEYGEKAFQLDAGIEEIIRPTEELQYLRLNPACAEPRITIRSNGSEKIKQVLIEYGWKGFALQRYNWNGELAFGESATIDLPWLHTQPSAASDFICRLVWVNGQQDEYDLNNTLLSHVEQFVPVLPSTIEVVIRTNNAASENYYTLTRSDGTEILKKDGMANNTIYRQTVNLSDGCYELNLMDDGNPPSNYPLNEDGLGWWANTNDGTGLFQLRNPVSNTLIKSFGVDFGTGIWYQFRVGNNTTPAAPTAGLSVYPNPVSKDLLVDLGQNSNTRLTVTLIGLSGQKVLEIDRSGELDALQYIDISGVTRGMYILRVSAGEQSLTQKLLLN